MANTNPPFHVVESSAGASDPEEDLISLLRLDPSQIEAAVKIPITVQVKKPPKQEFIRVHPDLELPVRALELKDDSDGGLYLVTPAMTAALQEESASYCLRPYMNRAGPLRLWPIRLPDPDGRQNEWHRSAGIAAALAMKKWVRVTANRNLGGYEVFEALNQPPSPEWPKLGLPDMLRLAFRSQGRIIEDVEHPVVKQLLGRL
jgi:hypothetical protein